MTRAEFLERNDAIFARLLRRLRANLQVPRREEDFDKAYKNAVKRLTRDYAEDYGETLERQIESSASRALEKPAKTALEFMFAAGAIAELRKLVSNPVSGIAKEVAKEAMFAELPSGYTLSGRIWNLGTYEKDILQIINNGFLNHLNPESIAKQLDGFLLPGREVTTLTPYGRTLNFDSMRLARTEVIHAERAATMASIEKTPWVTGVMWDGSGGCPICKDLDGNVYESYMSLPDPHPQCNCPVIEQVMSQGEWDDALSDYMEYGTDNLGIADWLAA